MATEAQKVVFREALQQARADAGISQRTLAKALGVSPGTVALWETGETAPRIDMTTELEKALEVEEGSFGRILGYLPIGAQYEAMISVVDAIKADSRLGDRERELLTTMYRELVKQRRKHDLD